jgi:phage regulator Rha-like protein
MSNLVYLAPNTKEPFTTSEVIAECAGVKRHAIQSLIQQHEKDFREFGRVAFEMRPLQTRGGQQMVKVYHLNEQQATLLMTYLRNTEVVRAFKKELVRQFYAMRKELLNVRIAKAERKPVRLVMTDAIKALPDSPHKQFKYNQYTDLAYRVALGKSAKQLRRERGATNTATASDYMSSEEIAAVSSMENHIAVLLNVGMEYQQIKGYLARMRTLPAAGTHAG